MLYTVPVRDLSFFLIGKSSPDGHGISKVPKALFYALVFRGKYTRNSLKQEPYTGRIT
jgi:hypothetical protein